MSTFDGIIKEYPLISIDCFLEENFASTTYFLSHCHSDHMHGLNRRNFFNLLESRGFSKIYLSDVSSHILNKLYKYEHLSDYLVVLPIEEPTIIKLYDESGKVHSRVLVTLLTAGHCLGSVMFLIEGDNGKVLYTGDFRLPVGSSSRLIHLHEGNNCLKPLKSLYVDTTFCNEKCLYIPSREECLDAVISIVEPWLSNGPNYIVCIMCPYEYAYEFVFAELYKRFGIKTHVTEDKRELYVGIKGIEDAVTSNASEARIHACALHNSDPFKQKVYPDRTPCGFISPDKKPVNIKKIKPSAMFFEKKDFKDICLFDPYIQMDRVCYSTHSSLSEIRDMVDYLKPENVYPNVVKDQTEKEILDLIFHPQLLLSLETKSTNSSISPLGQLKTPQIKDLSSPENYSLPFFDDCYEIPKEQMNIPSHLKNGSHISRMNENLSIDTDFENTNEQETILKQEIFSQVRRTVNASGFNGLPLIWQNPIISSDEEVFDNSSLDSSLKEKCDSDITFGTSEENNVKPSNKDENNENIFPILSTPNNSYIQLEGNYASTSLIDRNCVQYSSYRYDNNNIACFEKNVPQAEMKYSEITEKSNAKDLKEYNEKNELQEGPLNTSCNSSSKADIQNQSKDKITDLKNSNIISDSTLIHPKPCTSFKFTSTTERDKTLRECRKHSLETSLSGLVSDKVSNFNMQESLVNTKLHKSSSFHFIKKINDSSDSEDEILFKHVIKLCEKGNMNSCKESSNVQNRNEESKNLLSNNHIQMTTSLKRELVENGFNGKRINEDLAYINSNDVKSKELESYSKTVNNILYTGDDNITNENQFKPETSNIKDKKAFISPTLSHCHITNSKSIFSELNSSNILQEQKIIQESVNTNFNPSGGNQSSTTIPKDQNDNKMCNDYPLQVDKIKDLNTEVIDLLSENSSDEDFISEPPPTKYRFLSYVQNHNVPGTSYSVTNCNNMPSSKVGNPDQEHKVESASLCSKLFPTLSEMKHYSNPVPAFKDKIPFKYVIKIPEKGKTNVQEKSKYLDSNLIKFSLNCSLNNENVNEESKTLFDCCSKNHVDLNTSLNSQLVKTGCNEKTINDNFAHKNSIKITENYPLQVSKIQKPIVEEIYLSSDDSNDEIFINQPVAVKRKMLSDVQNLNVPGTSYTGNECNNMAYRNEAISHIQKDKLETTCVSSKMFPTSSKMSHYSNTENSYTLQRLDLEYKYKRKTVENINKPVMMQPNNSSKDSPYSIESPGHFKHGSSLANKSNNKTDEELNTFCQKEATVAEKASTSWEIKSVSLSSSSCNIIVEELNSSSDLEDSPSIIAPIKIPTVSCTHSNSFVNKSFNSKRRKVKYENDFSLNKNHHCDKLTYKICDNYLKDSDSTPEDLIENCSLISNSNISAKRLIPEFSIDNDT